MIYGLLVIVRIHSRISIDPLQLLSGLASEGHEQQILHRLPILLGTFLPDVHHHRLVQPDRGKRSTGWP